LEIHVYLNIIAEVILFRNYLSPYYLFFMNIAFDKRQRQFLGVSIWFLPVPALLSLSIVALSHVRTIVAFGVVLLIPALCYVDALAAQSNDKRGLELPQAVSSGVNLLGPPNKGGPVVVRTAFKLQDINEIDDEAETFQFTGVLTLTWQDKRQAFDPDKERIKEKIYQGDYQFNEVSPAWYPQVVLANESGIYDTHGVLLRVQPDGTTSKRSQLLATSSITTVAGFFR
jgi:hypothetical protein